jgi:hypothetical protein
MTIDTPDTISPLMQKFQGLYDLFAEFDMDAAELHEKQAVRDDASRAVFNSLSRIMAFTNQMTMLMSLMREDVRIVDELTADPVAASWADPIERCFYEWLRTSKDRAPNVN